MSYQDTELTIIFLGIQLVIILLFVVLFAVIFWIFDKLIFKRMENNGRRFISRIGGRNSEKYVDADVKIICNDDKIIWTRASKQFDVSYQVIEKIEDTSEYIYILIDSKSVIWIPSEAFISMKERENLINYIKFKIQGNNAI